MAVIINKTQYRPVNAAELGRCRGKRFVAETHSAGVRTPAE
jgi:hypothetical protein